MPEETGEHRPLLLLSRPLIGNQDWHHLRWQVCAQGTLSLPFSDSATQRLALTCSDDKEHVVTGIVGTFQLAEQSESCACGISAVYSLHIDMETTLRRCGPCRITAVSTGGESVWFTRWISEPPTPGSHGLLVADATDPRGAEISQLATAVVLPASRILAEPDCLRFFPTLSIVGNVDRHERIARALERAVANGTTIERLGAP